MVLLPKKNVPRKPPQSWLLTKRNVMWFFVIVWDWFYMSAPVRALQPFWGPQQQLPVGLCGWNQRTLILHHHISLKKAPISQGAPTPIGYFITYTLHVLHVLSVTQAFVWCTTPQLSGDGAFSLPELRLHIIVLQNLWIPVSLSIIRVLKTLNKHTITS